jgi:hypothetical protein
MTITGAGHFWLLIGNARTKFAGAMSVMENTSRKSSGWLDSCLGLQRACWVPNTPLVSLTLRQNAQGNCSPKEGDRSAFPNDDQR